MPARALCHERLVASNRESALSVRRAPATMASTTAPTTPTSSAMATTARQRRLSPHHASCPTAPIQQTRITAATRPATGYPPVPAPSHFSQAQTGPSSPRLPGGQAPPDRGWCYLLPAGRGLSPQNALEQLTVMSRDRRVHQLIVGVERSATDSIDIPPLRRRLDIREQERCGLRRVVIVRVLLTRRDLGVGERAGVMGACLRTSDQRRQLVVVGAAPSIRVGSRRIVVTVDFGLGPHLRGNTSRSS